MDPLKKRVEQASQLNRPGHDYLVNDLWREILNLREQVAGLLEALRGVVAVADRNTDEFDRARAAIAKAVEPT